MQQNAFALIELPALLIITVWIPIDVFMQKTTLCNIWDKANLCLKRKEVWIPVLLTIFANWICLFALGFQGFLILICVAIYAVLIQSVAISGDAINSIWSIVGYTVLLCFSLFKTSSVTKSVLGAH